MLGICSSWARTRPDRSHQDYTEIIPIRLRLPLARTPAAGFLFLRARPPEEERYLASASCQSVRVSGTLSSSPFRIPSPPPKCTALSGLPFSPCSNPHLYSAPFLCLILALYICPVLLFLALKLCWGWSLLVSCNAGASVPCGAWLALISISA